MLKCFITLCIYLFFYYSEASSSSSGRTVRKTGCPITEESCEEKFELSIGVRLTNNYRGKNKLRKPGNYHQLMLVQQSPITAFYQHQHAWPNTNTNDQTYGLLQGTCAALFTPERWVLHGLWPIKCARRSPTFCLHGVEEYNESSMNSSLLERLYKEWPDFVSYREKGSLLGFQWTKHGSCAADRECMNTVPKYFEKSLEYLNKYNIGDILKKCDIVPGHTYTLDEVINCITKKIEKVFHLKCLIDQYSETKEQYLYEVRLCFNKETLLLYDCYHGITTLSCDLYKNLSYPKLQKISL